MLMSELFNDVNHHKGVLFDLPHVLCDFWQLRQDLLAIFRRKVVSLSSNDLIIFLLGDCLCAIEIEIPRDREHSR